MKRPVLVASMVALAAMSGCGGGSSGGGSNSFQRVQRVKLLKLDKTPPTLPASGPRGVEKYMTDEYGLEDPRCDPEQAGHGEASYECSFRHGGSELKVGVVQAAPKGGIPHTYGCGHAADPFVACAEPKVPDKTAPPPAPPCEISGEITYGPCGDLSIPMVEGQRRHHHGMPVR